MRHEEICTDKAPRPVGPYSQAIEHNGTLFVSGQIPLDPATGSLIKGDIEQASHQVMKNLQAILEKSGSSLKKVVKCSIFVKDLSQFATINEIYGSYLSKPYPARETIEVSELPLGAELEISAIAYI